MKHIKKFASLLLAATLMMSMGLTAVADDGETAPDVPVAPVTDTTALDDSITVTGLSEGDQVTFYQLYKWDGEWVAVSEAVGKISTADNIKENGIDAAMAADFGKLAGSMTPAFEGVATVPADGTVTKNITGNHEAGLYMCIIIPKESKYVYNPVFVGADFVANDSNTINMSGSIGYSDAAKAKRSEITVDKEMDDPEDITVGLGSEIPFTITVTVPAYADNYTNPEFVVTDELSDGLMLLRDKDNNHNITVDTSGVNDLVPGSEPCTITPSNDDKGFTVTFTPDFLKAVSTPTEITIKYTAKVVELTTTNVTQDDNFVKVEFSNDPSDSSKHGLLVDRTNHYTFDLNGNLFGSTETDNYVTDVVKVGLDSDGNPVYKDKTTQLPGSGDVVTPLEGAKFTLAFDKDGKNPVREDLVDLVSDAKGFIHAARLDEGTYWLVETEAPEGFIKSAPVAVKIEAKYSEKEIDATETIDIDGKQVEVTYKTKILESYKVSFSNDEGATWTEAASYTFTNTGDKITNVTQNPIDPGQIVNTRGVELPSTGGMGTTIFYVLGTVLVLGAGVLLVTKRRMGDR